MVTVFGDQIDRRARSMLRFILGPALGLVAEVNSGFEELRMVIPPAGAIACCCVCSSIC